MISKSMAFEGICRAYQMMHTEDLCVHITAAEARSVLIEMMCDLATDGTAFKPLLDEESETTEPDADQ